MDNYSILKELEDFLTYQNVENIKNEFIRLYHEEDQLHNCNSETGIFDIYNSETSKFDTISFENSRLAELLWKKTQDIKIKIDTILIKTNGSKNETSGFINYLNNTISSIRQNQVELFKKFPICDKPLFTIEKYLLDKYGIQLDSTKRTYIQSSVFKPKPDITSFVFRELYNLADELNMIDETTPEEFVSALMDNKTDDIITFTCETPIAVHFLVTISQLFSNLNARAIEESKRFYTKQGKEITASNYDKSKNKLKKMIFRPSIKIY